MEIRRFIVVIMIANGLYGNLMVEDVEKNNEGSVNMQEQKYNH